MELINKDTPQVKEFISSLDSMLDSIESSEEINSLTCGVSLFINSMIERLFY